MWHLFGLPVLYMCRRPSISLSLFFGFHLFDYCMFESRADIRHLDFCRIRRLKMYWDTIKKISWVGFLLRIWVSLHTTKSRFSVMFIVQSNLTDILWRWQVQDWETMDHFYQCTSAFLLFCPIQQPKATLVQSLLRIHHQMYIILE